MSLYTGEARDPGAVRLQILGEQKRLGSWDDFCHMKSVTNGTILIMQSQTLRSWFSH